MRPASVTPDTYTCNIYHGIAPDKLYNAVMVYKDNTYWFNAMDTSTSYYFSIEAINENGVSPKASILKSE
jgi:xylan 1,4-beta-xylosidase